MRRVSKQSKFCVSVSEPQSRLYRFDEFMRPRQQYIESGSHNRTPNRNQLFSVKRTGHIVSDR